MECLDELQRRARRRPGAACAAAECPSVQRLPHGARLAPTKTCAPSTKSTCSAGRCPGAPLAESKAPSSRNALGQRLRDRLADARQLLAVVGVGRFEMQRSEDELSARRVRRAGQRRSRRETPRSASTSGVTRSGRPFVVAASKSACGPVPKNSERTKTGGCLQQRARPALRVERARRGDDEAAAGGRVDLDARLGGCRDASQVRRGLGLEAGAAMRDDARGARRTHRDRRFIACRSSDRARRAGRRPAG